MISYSLGPSTLDFLTTLFLSSDLKSLEIFEPSPRLYKLSPLSTTKQPMLSNTLAYQNLQPRSSCLYPSDWFMGFIWKASSSMISWFSGWRNLASFPLVLSPSISLPQYPQKASPCLCSFPKLSLQARQEECHTPTSIATVPWNNRTKASRFREVFRG